MNDLTETKRLTLAAILVFAQTGRALDDAADIRDAQRKFIKYNHLVANLLIFHNVVTMSKALERLIAEGYAVDVDLIACSSPYLTAHLNRFGRYDLNRDRVPEPLESIREFRMPSRGERNSRSSQLAV
jgi:hypothetical protein